MSEAVRELNLRLPPEVEGELEEIAREEGLEKTALTTSMLTKSIKRWKLERAIKLYQEGRVTMARAAEIAGVSLYEMMDIIHQRGIPCSTAWKRRWRI